jgi:predicted protein tyrosine phosphatase
VLSIPDSYEYMAPELQSFFEAQLFKPLGY